MVEATGAPRTPRQVTDLQFWLLRNLQPYHLISIQIVIYPDGSPLILAYLAGLGIVFPVNGSC